ncbi:MAG: DUF4160 domain-containing protein [Chloroflexi bacterium]|nr:DUF4160 domain-containing protein [Chloroflexota bacterium]
MSDRLGGATPTVLREGPYLFFYACYREEPPHVHVERDRQTAKIWLQPVQLERSGGLSPPEIRRITRTVVDNETLFLEAWHERFDT